MSQEQRDYSNFITNSIKKIQDITVYVAGFPASDEYMTEDMRSDLVRLRDKAWRLMSECDKQL